MEKFSALLAICVGNSPVTGEFPAQGPVTRSFGVFFDQQLNKRLRKQWRGWRFETPWRPLWRHCNADVHCWTHHKDTPRTETKPQQYKTQQNYAHIKWDILYILFQYQHTWGLITNLNCYFHVKHGKHSETWHWLISIQSIFTCLCIWAYKQSNVRNPFNVRLWRYVSIRVWHMVTNYTVKPLI